jgi:hypothetical protein
MGGMGEGEVWGVGKFCAYFGTNFCPDLCFC